ncbi:MAG: SOS response-associated peptidase family protein [Acetobacteraceae bacterium]|nr:SOS response-associated peptidase family protein [Acetobacteraceae bacterium]
MAIVTTSATAELAAIRDRMPLVLDEADWPVWLDEARETPRRSCARPRPNEPQAGSAGATRSGRTPLRASAARNTRSKQQAVVALQHCLDGRRSP